MFRYDDTGECSSPGEKQIKVVTDSRDKKYAREVLDKKGNLVKTLQSKGWEIVSESVIDPKGPNKNLIHYSDEEEK